MLLRHVPLSALDIMRTGEAYLLNYKTSQAVTYEDQRSVFLWDHTHYDNGLCNAQFTNLILIPPHPGNVTEEVLRVAKDTVLT